MRFYHMSAGVDMEMLPSALVAFLIYDFDSRIQFSQKTRLKHCTLRSASVDWQLATISQTEIPV